MSKKILYVPAQPKPKAKIIIKSSSKTGHKPHRSGSGTHSSQPKRLRTRSNQLKAALEN